MSKRKYTRTSTINERRYFIGCRWCGQSFQAATPRARYCRPAHCEAARRDRLRAKREAEEQAARERQGAADNAVIAKLLHPDGDHLAKPRKGGK